MSSPTHEVVQKPGRHCSQCGAPLMITETTAYINSGRTPYKTWESRVSCASGCVGEVDTGSERP